MKLCFNKQFLSCLVIIASIIIINAGRVRASETVLSDPDHISTGIEFRGVPDLRLGDTFGSERFFFGGMVEIRNESRFNQGILPNHNWRGFLSINYDFSLADSGQMLILTPGFEHESAHPTMGLNDGNDRAYDKIYDGTYRNINLNSFTLKLSSSTGSGYSLILNGGTQFYFKSRNTPELPVNDLTWTGGFSGGFELRYPVWRNANFFISGFDRYIFRSRKKAEGNIYYDTPSAVQTRFEDYPVINNTNTISAKTGFVFSGLVPERIVSVYFGILYGNSYGFVDSREKRTVFSLGIEIFR